MYTLINGLGAKWRPFATFFAVAGLIGTLCVMQANQLVESITTVFTTPAGIPNTPMLRFVMGVLIALIVGSVIIGGIRRISAISSKIVPIMVGGYMLLVAVILCLGVALNTLDLAILGPHITITLTIFNISITDNFQILIRLSNKSHYLSPSSKSCL